ncbi:MAG: adenylate/guanylate cyclase domain-containing protein, partial [bacterium]
DAHKDAGSELYSTIHNWINDSDLIIALITKQSQKAWGMVKELIYAKELKKKIIVLMNKDMSPKQYYTIKSQVLKLLENIIYIQFKERQFHLALGKIMECIQQFKKEKSSTIMEGRPQGKAEGKIPEYKAIVFMDLASSTELNYLIGDRGYKKLINDLESLIRGLTPSFNGDFIKSLGDGFLLTFEDAKKGVRFALNLQKRINKLAKLSISQALSMRIGIHFGSPIPDYDETKKDWIGIDVTIASRVCGKVDGGKIYITEAVYNLLRGEPKLRDKCKLLGDFELKGISEKIPIYEVLWDERQKPKKPEIKVKPEKEQVKMPPSLHNQTPPEPNFVGRIEMLKAITDWYGSPEVKIGEEFGKLQHPEFTDLLKYIADASFKGLCLITTRFPLSDIENYPSYQKLDVEELSKEDTRLLFQRIGVGGTEDEIDEVWKEFNGHTLSLVLLANYLGKGGDIKKAKEIPPFYSDKEAGGKGFTKEKAYCRRIHHPSFNQGLF